MENEFDKIKDAIETIQESIAVLGKRELTDFQRSELNDFDVEVSRLSGKAWKLRFEIENGK